MIEEYAVLSFVLLFCGAVIGGLAVLAVGIHRERKTCISDWAAQGARVANGLYARTPEQAPPLDHWGRDHPLHRQDFDAPSEGVVPAGPRGGRRTR